MILNDINSTKSDYKTGQAFWIIIELQREGQGRQRCVKIFDKGISQEQVAKLLIELAEDIKNQ